MVRLNKYCLLVFAAITLAIPGCLAAQAKRSSTPKVESRDEQTKHRAEPKSGSRKESGKTFLHKDWEVQSSCDDKASGDKVSSAGFEAGRWHRTDIPATVVGVLVTDKTYPDPNYGTNLKNFPGLYASEEDIFRQCGYAAGQSFCLFVVVSHGIYGAGGWGR